MPRTAADCVIIRKREDFEILLITRKKPGKFQGKHAFPGGHIDYNEDPMTSALRELEEECGLKGCNPKLLTVRGAPERDDRYHMISIVYLVELQDDNQEPTAQDDAASAAWYNLRDVMKTPDIFAFDHHSILEEMIKTRNEYKDLS